MGETNEMAMMACGCAAQGVNTTTRAPVCVVHDCDEVAGTAPDLSGRTARCECGVERPSSPSLAFFEHCGPGSREATDICNCGYARVAHTAGRVKCPTFMARGPLDNDRFYCGCRGWD